MIGGIYPSHFTTSNWQLKAASQYEVEVEQVYHPTHFFFYFLYVYADQILSFSISYSIYVLHMYKVCIPDVVNIIFSKILLSYSMWMEFDFHLSDLVIV